MDGSSSLSKYHQSFYNSNRNNLQDSDLLVTATSPLRVYVHSDPNNFLWNNIISQSIRFCRTIMLEHIKENKKVVLKIKEEVEKEIFNLHPFKVYFSGNKYVSMIDGKIFVHITDTSSMQCYPICHATPNMMSNLKIFKEGFVADGQALCCGISALHAWIRFFEFILYISYRIEIKTWKVKKVLKDQYFLRKKFIHDKIFEKFGLRVDERRAGGSETSNTGNLCRRAFSDPLYSAKP